MLVYIIRREGQNKKYEIFNASGQGNLFKKIGAIKRTFHAMLGTRKEIKDKDLTEVEEIKEKWQEYTGDLYKKRSS